MEIGCGGEMDRGIGPCMAQAEGATEQGRGGVRSPSMINSLPKEAFNDLWARCRALATALGVEEHRSGWAEVEAVEVQKH